MTKQESFKRRIRERMAKTGERYGAARRALLDRPAGDGARPWASPPEHSDDAIRAATGRGWDEWCDLIDAWPGHDDGHTAIAAWVHEHHGDHLTHWWAQSVTVGYERITGRRVPYQRADGSFAANRSRTVTADADELRAMLLDDEARADLFGGQETTLRSKPTTKALRFGFDPGMAIVTLEPQRNGRVKIAISHEQLADLETTEEWRHWWGEWLDAIDAVEPAEGSG